MGDEDFKYDLQPNGPLPTVREARELQRQLRNLRLLEKMEGVGERMEVSNAIEGLSNIMHDLDADCDCATCAEVREIRRRHDP